MSGTDTPRKDGVAVPPPRRDDAAHFRRETLILVSCMCSALLLAIGAWAYRAM
jgi:hypothetical protein